MKIFCTGFLVLILLTACNRPLARPDVPKENFIRNQEVILEHHGKKRTYLLYIPQGYQEENSYPLVMVFHGGIGNAKNMRNHYGFINASDERKFIAVFPNGATRFDEKLATWNAGDCCGYAVKSQSDDVGFVKKILDDVQTRVDIDPHKIYATGFSNGGMFSYRLACEMSDVFDSVAAVAGTKNIASCQPSEVIPVLHIHAKDDQHVLYDGGCGQDCSTGVDYSSVIETVTWWAAHNQCNTEKIETVLNFDNGQCQQYTDCLDKSAVRFCTLDSGGHSWPGSVNPKKRSAEPISSFEATETILDFFEI